MTTTRRCPKCGSSMYQQDADPARGHDHQMNCANESCQHTEPVNGHDEPSRLGTPISQLSGRPGHPGFERFDQIARSWGYE